MGTSASASPGAPPPAASSGGMSKQAKIVRRTIVGGGLALALAGLLWIVHATQSNALVLGVGIVFAALCVYEGARLGGNSSLRLHAPLSVAWLMATAFAFAERSAMWFALLLIVFASGWTAIGIAAFDQRSRGGWDRALGAAALCGAIVAVAASIAIATGRDGYSLVLGRALLWWLGLHFALTLFSDRAKRAERRAAWWMSVWLALPFTWLHHVAADWHVSGLIALAILSKIGDTAGYYFGNAFGKHHPFKTISPGKTTEGCLASLAAGIAAGVALVQLELLPAQPFGLFGGACVGAFTNIAAQAGDLFESWVKRKAGVKDSGTWFGPSGGVLDLVDSFLFTIPTALLVWPLVLDVPAAVAR